MTILKNLKLNYPEQIRKYFVPYQPSVLRFQDKVGYEEYAPGIQLRNYIYCFWQLKSEATLQTPFTYRVVSDGCIDVFFNVDHPVENFVMGLATKHVASELGNKFNYVGIRFFPAAFPMLFKMPAMRLTDEYIALDSVLCDFSNFIANEACPESDFQELINSLESYLIEEISEKDTDYDHRFYDAFVKLLKGRGCAEIKDLAVGLSLRQLRRLFNNYIGTSPKTFSKIVRFQHVLAAKPSRESLRRDKMFYDFGYFDQAHFIRDFKGFYGLTPSKAVD